MPVIHISEFGCERDCELKEPVNHVGRSAANQVVLKDINVSREHCQIVREGERWVLRDQGSHNGVEVNGARVAEAHLHDGDVIRIAKAVLTFRDASLSQPPLRPEKVTTRRIGEMCVERGILSRKDLDAALATQKETHQKLGEILTSEGYVSPEKFLETLGEQLNTPWINLTQYELSRDALNLFPRSKARIWCAVPVFYFREMKRLVVAMADPADYAAIQEVEFYTHCRVDVMLATKQDILDVIQKYYPVTEPEDDLSRSALAETARVAPVREPEADEDSGDDRALSKLVNMVIDEAIRQRASDIHIEPHREQILVRFRVDGMMAERRRIPKSLQLAITNRVKIMGKMDIAEKRFPQDGRHTYRYEGRSIDLRISSLPSVNGEKLVIRILNKDVARTSIEELGMSPELKSDFMRLLRKPEGMLLVTGPTGSGKTSTLYSALNTLRAVERNIVSLEDPVELEIEGVTQAQTYDHPDFNFASGLRAILRQDPNIIMVGEIRDRETAQIAVQAGLTGHMVLASIHTNSAPATLPRLIDIGVEPYLLTASLVGVLAQRLVRVICPACRVEDHPPEEVVRGLLPALRDDLPKFFRGTGCSKCFGGYLGRTGIFELLVCDEEIQRLITRNAQTPEVRESARARGMITLREDAVRKAVAGVTSLDEVMRVTFTDS